MENGRRFKFVVLGRYPARLRGNEPQVTVNLAAGTGDRLAYCGTLTMSEEEWSAFLAALRAGLKEDVEVDDGQIAHVI